MTAEYDLALNPESQPPVVRLCTMVLSEALIGSVPAVRMYVGKDERGTVEYERDGKWEMVMQVPLPAYRPMVERMLEMSDQAGAIRVRYEEKHRVLSVQVEDEAEPRIVISGFTGSAA